MKNRFGAALFALLLLLVLVLPTLAQSAPPTTPQADNIITKLFLPLISATDAQVAVADEVADEVTDAEVPAEVQLAEAALLELYVPQIAAAAIAVNGKIAFSSDADGDFDIYTINPNGTGLFNVTNALPALHQSQPDWSPDGARLVFTDGDPLANFSPSNLWAINADGTNPTQLTFEEDPEGLGIFIVNNEPDWSPDGTKIAFTTVREGDFDIYVINADGSNPHNMFISEPTYEYAGYPAVEWDDYDASWSPDGTKLLYTASRPTGTQIALLDAAGVGPEAFLTGGNELVYNSEAEWSPDGQLITFINRNYVSSLWMMNADGSNQTDVTPTNVLSPFSPEFSPDGTQLTLIGYPWGVLGADSDLFTMPVPPLTAPVTAAATTATATQLTRVGRLNSAAWHKKSTNTMPLYVSISATGGASGLVTSRPVGITCGSQCNMTVRTGTQVALTAKPAADSKFVAWGGACRGKAKTCVVKINQLRFVVAYFAKRR